jgi:hypothetical protein
MGSREAEQLSRYGDGRWAEQSGFKSRECKIFVLFSTETVPALESTQPPIQWVPLERGAISVGVWVNGIMLK